MHNKMPNQMIQTEFKQASSAISNHRKFILQALERVENGELTTLIMKDAPSDTFALSQEILYGILRWKGTLERLISENVKKTPKKGVRFILFIALYELLYLQKPPHAVIDQAVRLCKAGKFMQQHKFVNAFLRHFSQNYPSDVMDSIFSSAPLHENFPPHLQKLWKPFPNWLKSLQVSPRIALVFKNVPSDSLALDMKLEECRIDGIVLSKVYFTGLSGSVASWPGYQTGEWWVMNPAAVKTVDLLLQHIADPKQSRVLDVCAAPGGKSFRLASEGCQVTAMDIHEKRLSMFTQNTERLGLTIPTFVQDGSCYNPDISLYDAVFLDAPCSGLGVIRKHPEIRWNRSEVDVQSNAVLQRRILETVSRYVKENGFLAYCVCSLHSMEGVDVVHEFLSIHANWDIIDRWSTPIASDHMDKELLDGFQVFILKKSVSRTDA